MAAMAQMLSAPDQSAPDQRETRLEAVIVVMSNVTHRQSLGGNLSPDGHRNLTGRGIFNRPGRDFRRAGPSEACRKRAKAAL
jgi:hypothetical protein